MNKNDLKNVALAVGGTYVGAGKTGKSKYAPIDASDIAMLKKLGFEIDRPPLKDHRRFASLGNVNGENYVLAMCDGTSDFYMIVSVLDRKFAVRLPDDAKARQTKIGRIVKTFVRIRSGINNMEMFSGAN